MRLAAKVLGSHVVYVDAAGCMTNLFPNLFVPARAQQVEILPPAFSVPLHSVDDGSARQERALASACRV